MTAPRAIRIAVTAMGGQGGGVLANWIVRLGERAGYVAQSTSVPGVAQRTGATVYYVELFPEAAARQEGKAPVLALMPASGDVDIVLAAEFMEAGRAILRGFVSERTTLIASSHRDYAIAEKIGLGDARRNIDNVRAAARKAAGRYIEADMAAAAAEAGAVISAVMFGALAGSRALPIPRDIFETTISEGGRAVEANLRGFALGFDLAARGALRTVPAEAAPEQHSGANPSPAVAPLLKRLGAELPAEVRAVAFEGLKRCVDFQDVGYGGEYLDRLREVAALDRETSPDSKFKLTGLVAKHLALWMTYEDMIRVADLKTRRVRFERFRSDVKAEDGQIVQVREYLHPRVEEICDILPPGMARAILDGGLRRSLLERVLGAGRRVHTTGLRGFLQLWMLSRLKFMRRHSFRHETESARIRSWLDAVSTYARRDYAFACETAALQRLLKGYGDTHARGLSNFTRIMERLGDAMKADAPARTLAGLCEAALADEHGAALDAALAALAQPLRATG